MIIPDINLLLSAYDSFSPFHATALTWWKECLSGTEPVGLPSIVIFGFVGTSMNDRVFEHPMTPKEAGEHVRAWLRQPQVQVLELGPQLIRQALRLLKEAGTGENLVTHAQIAALAIEYQAVLHTSDTNFMRFNGVTWYNPITGGGSKKSRK